jgi:ankyrin repeat protein
LIIAAINGHQEISRSLIVHGANINIKDHKGRDALMHAAERNHSSVIETLLIFGAKRSIKKFTGQTALPVTANNDRNRSHP